MRKVKRFLTVGYTMCGIVGYTGNINAISRVIKGLYALEYRGSDSAGIAYFAESGQASPMLSVKKAVGKIRSVEALFQKEPNLLAYTAIGHTRWATHGAPTVENAHPHGTTQVQIVHNGIIENNAPIKAQLLGEGYTFKSETDTEVAALLLDKLYKEEKDPLRTLRKAISLFEGSYALGVVFSDRAGEIYAIRKESPLVIGRGEEGNYMASDITAFLSETNRYQRLEVGEIALITADTVAFFDLDLAPIQKETLTAEWGVFAADKGGFEHFMRKEIHEEPECVVKTVSSRVKDGLPDFSGEKVDFARLVSAKHLYLVGCGTAMHAALYGAYVFQKVARLFSHVEIASEFRYADPVLGKEDAVIVVSQSGETADTLGALRLAKEKGAYTVAMVNTVGSSIAEEADDVIYTWAGPEISVASTKAYTVQTALFALLSLELAKYTASICEEEMRQAVEKLQTELPQDLQYLIEREEELLPIAKLLSQSQSTFYIGRGVDALIAMEGALKLKEISYIHAESYAAGELKHGAMSLITAETPVVAVCSTLALKGKMLSNCKEVAARSAPVVAILPSDPDGEFASVIDHLFLLHKEKDSIFTPILASTVLQLLAYHTARLLGCDVDQPRNLAKSVTVE